MRIAVVLAALLGLHAGSGCDRDDTAGPPRAAPPADSRRRGEQAEFDADRRPDVLVATIGLKPGDRVADVGAGTGLLTVHVARAVKPGGKVVATDVDAAVLDLLAARLAEAGLADLVERRVVAPDQPGLEPGAFDVILLSQVDHYFADPPGWLRAAIPALRPGGRIAIANRIHHRVQSMASAEAAGLRLVRESTDIPGHFVAVFEAPR